MLKLRKVELFGFKSFCERTEVLFHGAGVTAIVGPNGCGKSNLADAISWVLGEQSAKSLRGERMLDVIFNGTSTRLPTGIAEVTLTLVDPDYGKTPPPEPETDASDLAATDGDISSASSEFKPGRRQPAKAGQRRPINRPASAGKPGEIVIGRRLFRTGESEYLLNGRPCRLRDIQEIFMGMGLGPDSYAIIEQGRIGQILSSKPYDRRAIIEEAAGVTKYKTKRRLAEAKLESARQNLARVADILEEVAKQLGSLKRQASKARRYEELRKEMMSLARVLLRSRHLLLEETARSLAARLLELGQALEEKKAQLQGLEEEQAQASARNFELETELRALRNASSQATLDLDRAQNRIAYNREQVAVAESRIQELAAQSEELERQQAATREELTKVAQAREALQEELNGRRRALEERSLEASELTRLIAVASEEREQLRRRALDLLAEAAELRNQLSQVEEYIAAEERDQNRIREERARAVELHEQAAAQLGESRSRVHLERAQAELYAQEARELEGELRSAREAESSGRERLEEARQAFAATEARQQALDELLAHRSYSADSVQKLLAGANGAAVGFKAVGVLADFAEVDSEYEPAVEEFLREELDYVVVETFDEARAGVDLLRNQVGGRATFFVDSLGKRPDELARAQARLNSIQRPEVHDGIVCRLEQLVRFNGKVGDEVKRVLGKLQAAYLVKSGSSAERLAREYPDCYFVTPDGTFYHGRLVSGGRQSSGGPLTLKREVRELGREVGGLRARQESAEKTLQQISQRLTELVPALEQKTAARQEHEKELVGLELRLKQAEEELEESQKQVKFLDAELARTAEELSRAQEKRQQLAANFQVGELERSQVEADVTGQAERERELRAQAEAASQELAELKAVLAQLEERHLAFIADGRRLEAQAAEAGVRREQLAAQAEQLRIQHEQLLANTAEMVERLVQLEAEKSRLEQTSIALEAEWEQLRQRVGVIEDELRQLREGIGVQQESQTQAQIEQARNQAELSHLAEAVQDDLAISLEELTALELLPLSGEELAAAEENYRGIKGRLEGMGPINMMALEEYQQCEERHTFLTTQRDDLLASIADTAQTIQEIDTVSQQRFREAFEAINRHFAETFRVLFGGGSAEMRLTDMENSLESGIDLICQPPGKRLQNVLLLSGGEKALAALALLLAIFRYQPCPFCVLDEVDAPLDEANIGRFTRMVQEMSQNTQFIVITHSKKTMEIAPVLYGVTMQEPGVSALVSVRFEEPIESPAVAAD